MRACLLSLLLAAGLTAAESGAVSVTASTLGHNPVLIVRAPAGTPLSPAVAARLRLPVTVAWDGIDVASACDQLARLTGAPIVVAPELRATAAADIVLNVADMRADRVLEWVRTLGRVAVTPMNGGLYVSRQAPARPEQISVIAVGDLVHPIRDFPGPELSIPSPGGEGAGLNLFAEAKDDEGQQRMDAEELAAMLEEHLRR